ncbi:MAG: NHL repeat-containing protein [Nevskia sp.]
MSAAIPGAIRVGLKPSLKRPPSPSTMAVLDVRGPRVCIGGARGADDLAIPVRPEALTLFGPRGACLMAAEGPLWVCDTGHHRLLGWARAPSTDGIPADWLIGQPDFSREGRNAKGTASASTLNVPTGITPCGEGFAVADAWNHRVLIWQRMPGRHNAPADLVIGQADFASVESNRGARSASAASLFWPYGVHWDGARLWVADTGNRRVLMWQGLPVRNGQPANLVLGQASFDCRDENGGGEPNAASMRWPHAIACWRGRLCVSDAGNNRVMIWNTLPLSDNAPSDCLLGQNDEHLVDHNQSLYWPGAATLHMPYCVAAAGDWLIAADTANSRLIAWHSDDCRSGAESRALTGQAEFNAKGDNAWQPPTRNSLSWPYGISACGNTAVIADSGNNRILLWSLSPELMS